MKNKLLILFLFSLIFIGGCGLYNNEKIVENDDTKNLGNIMNYEPIYYINCNEELGTCSIPRASGLPMDSNTVCIWNYSSGNGNIPYIKITNEAYPTIEKFDAIWDLSVLCRDVNGKIYFGEEGQERQ